VIGLPAWRLLSHMSRNEYRKKSRALFNRLH
jgi:hypothetical protein